VIRSLLARARTIGVPADDDGKPLPAWAPYAAAAALAGIAFVIQRYAGEATDRLIATQGQLLIARTELATLEGVIGRRSQEAYPSRADVDPLQRADPDTEDEARRPTMMGSAS
jgi:hypothetical protein